MSKLHDVPDVAVAIDEAAGGNALVELTEDVSGTRYWSPDMAPVSRAGRKWGTWDIAALWISMSACITTYTLASGMISGGMNWWEAVLTIFLGNLVVLIPMILNAHAGTKYGIPFPVYCRASFGLRGANVPALLRAFIACGWFGIQTWFGGEALFTILHVLMPDVIGGGAVIAGLGISASQLACFLIFWAINMGVVYAGIDSIRVLLNVKAPLLILLGLLLLGWAYRAANGFGPMLSQPSAFDAGQPQAGKFWAFFFPALTGVVGYWATLSLNIPDFSRYAQSQKAQVVGQAVGLPTTMALYAFIGVAVTSATVVIFRKPDGSPGDPIWDPVVLSTHFKNPVVLVIAGVAMCVATLATNIAANIVSPANDFAHLAPKWISFRTGGFITGVIGIVMMPWKLVADPSGYIFTWLLGCSSLLGAVGGILIADYFLVRKMRLDLAGLYRKEGAYFYSGGVNLLAVVALVVGILPCVPGFVNTVYRPVFGDFWTSVYHYAWFVSFGVAMGVYAGSMRMRGGVTGMAINEKRMNTNF